MDDAVLVSLIERFGQLANDSQNLSLAESLVTLDDRRQRFAFDVGHRNELLAVDLPDVVDGTNVFVPEAGGGLRLAFESRQHFAGRIVFEVRCLERDLAPEHRVFREVDRPHRAAPERADNAIATEILQHRRVGRRRRLRTGRLRWKGLVLVCGSRLRDRRGFVVRASPIGVGA
jgi:hypothetical protein